MGQQTGKIANLGGDVGEVLEGGLEFHMPLSAMRGRMLVAQLRLFAQSKQGLFAPELRALGRRREYVFH